MGDNFLALLEKEAESIKTMLPSSENADRWWALAYEMTKRKELQEVVQKNPASLINAIKKCADWGLVPDGDECFINVYSGVAEAQPMYKGMIRRAVEAGAIAHCVADIIRSGDTIAESIDRHGRTLKHLRLTGGPKNRPMTGAYAIFWLPNGLMDYELFDAEDIERCREAARRNKGGKDSPAYQAFPGEMAKKSVLRRGLKRMRGKREDSSYNRMVAAETQFDREVEGTELPPDDLPTAGEAPTAERDSRKVEAARSTLASGSKKLALTPEVMPKQEQDRTLNTQEQDDALNAAKSMGLRVSDAVTVVFEACNVEDIADVKLSQLNTLMAAFQAKADAQALRQGADVQDRAASGQRMR